MNTIKHALTSPPTLACPDYTQTFTLQTDASGTGIGAVLTQSLDDEEHVIAYASRALSEAERRLARWALELLEYDFDITHRKGTMHDVPDALSRRHEDEEHIDTIEDTTDKWYTYKKTQLENDDEIELQDTDRWTDHLRRLQILRDEVQRHLIEANEKQAHYYNLRRRDIQFKEGDRVLKKNHTLSSGPERTTAKLKRQHGKPATTPQNTGPDDTATDETDDNDNTNRENNTTTNTRTGPTPTQIRTRRHTPNRDPTNPTTDTHYIHTGPPPEIIAIIANLQSTSTLEDELRAERDRYMTRRALQRTNTDETEASTSTRQPHTTHQTAPHKTQPPNTPDTDSDTDSTTSTTETVIHIETTHTSTPQTQTTDNDTDSDTDTTSLTDTTEAKETEHNPKRERRREKQPRATRNKEQRKNSPRPTPTRATEPKPKT
ncbi:salivary glue protein Sgs-3-like [Neodiprion virginianus]|uniref:salivary glue protein Sgs-3-like n=1 Tax=Neodiprion virginianus TaxID=2961670 RepID=UPI001EE6A6F0|nr:salivary glue protein Sgs-3-like [Neodiprion virginianus]